MASVKLEGVRKVYGDSGEQVAVHGVDLEIRNGEFVVLVGPSGCGKSTTLRMIAGLESISAGKLWIGERRAFDLVGGRRGSPEKAVREADGIGHTLALVFAMSKFMDPAPCAPAAPSRTMTLHAGAVSWRA